MTAKIKVGIVGTSWWTDLMYLPSLKSHPDAETVAICGRSRGPAEALAETYGIAAIYEDYRALLAHEGLDAVMIVTPDDTHCPMTLDAVDAGLHVLCEKPMALNAADARVMYDRAVAKGTKHMVLFTWRFQPYVRYLKQLVDAGYVGRCHQVQLEQIGGYAWEARYQWRFDGSRANGVCGDLGPHMFDLFRHLVGEVRSVSADLQQAVDRSGFEGPASTPVNDCGYINLRSVDGVQGMVHVSAAAHCADRDTMIIARLHGDQGSLEVEQILEGAERRVTLRGTSGDGSAFETLQVPANLRDGLADDDWLGPYSSQSAGPRFFIDAIRDNLEIPMSFLDGLRVQEIVDAALRSDTERRWIDLS